MDISQPHPQAGGSGDPYPIVQSVVAATASSQSVVVASSLQLAPQGVTSDVYVEANTMLISAFGYVVALQSGKETCNTNPAQDALDLFHQKSGCENFDYKQRGKEKKEWFFFEYRNVDLSRDLYDYLCTVCDVVALGLSAVGLPTALCRRSSYHSLELERFLPGTFNAPVLARKKNANDVTFRWVKAWIENQKVYHANFFTMSPDDYDETHVLTEWEGRTKVQVHTDINACKTRDKALRTPRQQFIANGHVQLLAAWHASLTEREIPYIVKISDDGIMHINRFSPKASEIMFSYVDVGDGSVHQFSAKEWIEERHATHTAVLHGGPKLGKTPLAKSMAAQVARLVPGGRGDLHFIQVSTLDILPRNGLSTGVPILLDEFNPSKERGGRSAHSCEDLKIITEIAEGGTLNGRGGNQGGDIHFPPMVPRIITCNAASPWEFWRELPDNVFTMTNGARMALSNDAKAILKRCAFFHIQQAVVPEGVAAARAADRQAAMKRRASDVFSGDNAIR